MHIDRTIIDAIFCGRLRPEMRLGEQEPATLFNVSRTVVRQSLTRLQARGLVTERRGSRVRHDHRHKRYRNPDDGAHQAHAATPSAGGHSRYAPENLTSSAGRKRRRTHRRQL
ncbi:GntR family transcriptional regulator [Agrobacterium salinitolerans]|uniref:GntR family transcriptional regulator n=1 Tax=Agrobacterium salinitolerans TaxID=1183413 RepID=A0A9X3KMB8_9HYPH|nr:GntR family transcriptional regulator [Agrobacterium salinitolerans]MCZ7854055.1 GntR family transcriptional regulator [Agrobacterium salinitolerans]MCZ7937459.1 GntR family transcriptional regulator [Agrobacterium salinitolerans]MCZ7975540.1 GntR family transcriptional regulator [Agrobacterium salinitolerans]